MDDRFNRKDKPDGQSVQISQDARGKSILLHRLALDPASTDEARRGLLESTASTATFRHANVLAVREVRLDDGALVFVQDFPNGPLLADRIEQDGPLPLAQAFTLMRAFAQGLGAAHAAGLTISQICPTEFVLQEAPTEGLLCLCPPVPSGWWLDVEDHGFASPEQAAAQLCDIRSTLFSSAAVLAHLVTGKRPVEASGWPSILASAKMPSAAHQALKAALETDPASRCATPAAWVTLIDAALDQALAPPAKAATAKPSPTPAVAPSPSPEPEPELESSFFSESRPTSPAKPRFAALAPSYTPIETLGARNHSMLPLAAMAAVAIFGVGVWLFWPQKTPAPLPTLASIATPVSATAEGKPASKPETKPEPVPAPEPTKVVVMTPPVETKAEQKPEPKPEAAPKPTPALTPEPAKVVAMVPPVEAKTEQKPEPKPEAAAPPVPTPTPEPVKVVAMTTPGGAKTEQKPEPKPEAVPPPAPARTPEPPKVVAMTTPPPPPPVEPKSALAPESKPEPTPKPTPPPAAEPANLAAMTPPVPPPPTPETKPKQEIKPDPKPEVVMKPTPIPAQAAPEPPKPVTKDDLLKQAAEAPASAKNDLYHKVLNLDPQNSAALRGLVESALAQPPPILPNDELTGWIETLESLNEPVADHATGLLVAQRAANLEPSEAIPAFTQAIAKLKRSLHSEYIASYTVLLQAYMDLHNAHIKFHEKPKADRVLKSLQDEIAATPKSISAEMIATFAKGIEDDLKARALKAPPRMQEAFLKTVAADLRSLAAKRGMTPPEPEHPAKPSPTKSSPKASTKKRK